MMEPLDTQDIVRLAEIMRTMIKYAKSGDWETLSRLDNERRKIIKFDSKENASKNTLVIKQDLALDMSPTIEVEYTATPDARRGALIAEIYTLDAQILGAVQAIRQRLVDKNRGLSAQLKAKDVYAKTCLMV